MQRVHQEQSSKLFWLGDRITDAFQALFSSVVTYLMFS